MYFHFVIILMIIPQCSDMIFALYKITKPIIKLSIYMSGFPKGVGNMGGLSQYMGGAWGGESMKGGGGA